MKRQENRLLKSRQYLSGLLGVIFLALIFGAFQSCSKKNLDFSKMTTPAWDPTWSLPLIHSELTLGDLLDSNSMIIEDPLTHMLTLEYASKLFSQTAEQYLVIPDQNNIKMESTTLNILVPPTDSIPYDITVPYSFIPAQAGQRLDSIFLKTASMKVDVSSYINHRLKVTISIPNATKNGKIFQTTLNLDYTGPPLPVEQILNLDLSGYRMVLNNSSGHYNEIIANAHLLVYGDNNPDLSPYTFRAILDLTGLKFTKIFGYLGVYEYPMSDTLFLNLFNNNLQGSIHLKEIDLFVNTVNSVGMPLQINFLDLIAYSAKNPPYTVDIADPASGFPNPITIPSPDIQHVGTVADTTFLFNDENSNIVPAINLSPEYIYFNLNGKSNPANNPAYENFVYDTSRFAVNLKVVLPLFGAISGFYVADTVKFDFDIPKEAEMLEFKVRTVNHFPLNADIQIYFADQNYKVLDSLFSGSDHQILKAAPVSGPPDYRVIENPPIQPLIISPDPFMASDLERLKKAKFIMIKAKMSTYNEDFVKIYADYMLDVKLAAKFQYNTQN